MRVRLIVGTLLALLQVAHAEVQLQMQVSTPVHVGEAAELSVIATGSQDLPAPNIPAVEGLQIQYRGPETQVSIVNGAMSSSITHHYRVTALKPGEYRIGPITAPIGSTSISAPAVALVVLAAGAATPNSPGPAGNQARVILETPRTNVYLHERLPITLKLMIGSLRVSQLSYPAVPGDGFSMEKFPEPARRQERTADGVFQVFEFKTTLTPLRTGTVTIGPATEQLEVLTGKRRSFFDEESQQVTIASSPIVLNVQPVPDAGKPPGYAGAVGQFEFEVAAAPLDLTVGDPVTITSTIRGRGTMDHVNPPVVAESDLLKTYPVQAGNVAAPAGVEQKSFEQVIIPQRPGTSQIPALRFSWFDPEAGVYRTITRGPFPLTVRPGKAGTTEPQIVGQKPAPSPVPEAEQLGRDIVSIKDDAGTFRPVGQRRWQSVWFWLWQLLPLSAWVGAGVVARQRAREAGDERYARFTRAGRDAKAALSKARDALSQGDRAGVYDQATAAVRDYLAAKLDLPPGDVSGATVGDRLRARKLDPTVATAVDEFFTGCEQVRFAPSAAGDAESALAKADGIVKTLERLRGLGMVLLMLLAVAGTAVAAGEGGVLTTFFHGNQLYGEAKYADAAAEYEKVLATGVESPALYFNLGNAYFKTGDIGQTILNYERARQFMPGDPDLRANLNFAREQSGDDDPTPLWVKVLLPLADRVGTETLLWAAAGAVALVFLLLAAAQLWLPARRTLGGIAVASGVLGAVLWTSAGYRLLTLDWPTVGVVIGKGTVPVRFEPQASGTMHFEAKPGVVVRIVGEREGWVQVERNDGRRGWAPSERIARR